MSADNTSSRQVGDYRADHQPESDIDVAHPTDPNTVDNTEPCGVLSCSRTMSAKWGRTHDYCVWHQDDVDDSQSTLGDMGGESV